MSLIAFNNKIIEFEKLVKRSKVRSIRKLTRQIEHEKKKNSDDERSKRKVNRIIEEIHVIRKMRNKEIVLFAMENEGTIAELLKKFKPSSDDIKQHALIRLASEKSLQTDLIRFKTSDDYAKTWRPLLIMYRSRYEKRLAWKEKEADFVKIEKALEDQQKELEEIEKKLPKPIKVKKKKEKPVVKRPKETVVYVLDLEKKTAEPFGKQASDDEVETMKEEEKMPTVSIPMETNIEPDVPVINDPFFLNSQHRISYQKRTNDEKKIEEIDDKRFIEQSYFIDALSSSSNRRDGGGDLARKKWAHLTPPMKIRPSKKPPLAKDSNKMAPNDDKPIHPSWEASKQARSQARILKSQAKKIVFNESDGETV